MFTLKFAFRNIVSRKSSLVIILFIAFSISVLIMANAVFDGTGNGIEKTFSSSFTGDVVIKPATDFPMSLFGDETPVTGTLSELPRLIPYTQLNELIKQQNYIKYTCPQLTGLAAIRVDDENLSAVLFGVDGQSYLNIMSGIHLLQGEPFAIGQKGIMLSTSMISKIEEKTSRKLTVGDEVQIASSNGSSLTLRSAPVTAVYEYEIKNDLLDEIVLVDPDTLRNLLGIESMTSAPLEIDESQSVLIDRFDSLDDLFGDDDAFCEVFEEVLEEEIVVKEEIASVEPAEDDAVQTTWNYIICKLDDTSKTNRAVKKLNKLFKQNEWNITAISWRAAAGMSAQYIYWMRLIFNIGLILLIGTGFIVVNNTLIISAMDRTRETGALRAIGADRKFIGIEYLWETLMLTVTAGILGCIIGSLGNLLLVNAHITFSNSYLIQLFGGAELKTRVTLSNIMSGMGLSGLLAIIGWLYPVHIALDTSPVVAMEAIK